MYRAPSKQRQLIKRVLVYGAMTATVLLLVTALVFVMLGYRFNKETSTIEQGGLVQFNTRPTDASVTIGSAKLTDRTPSKITVNPGTYTVTMAKDGYHTWTKSADVKAGQVLWLNYAQLVPTTIETKQLTDFKTIAEVLASPNGDRYALLPVANKSTLDFVDITADAPKQTTMTLPETALPKNLASIDLKSWGSDSDHLLLIAKAGNATEWLVTDRRDAEKTTNISTKYDLDIAEAVFDPRSNNRVIVRTAAGDVRIVDINQETVSGAIASSVTYMAMYSNDAILVVQRTAPTVQSVGYVSFGSNEVRQLQEIMNDKPTLVAGASYFGDPYISIANGTELTTYKLNSLPSSESEASVGMTNLLATTIPSDAKYLSAKSGGRFVLAQYSKGLLTYDIELKKQSNTSFTKGVAEELRWLDRYHFYLTNGTSLEMLEFDGGNSHEITSLATSFDAILRSNGKYIYSFNTTADGKFTLQRSQMILDS